MLRPGRRFDSLTSMRCCTKCGIDKPISEFKSDRRKQDGRATCCKLCCAIACAQWRKTHPAPKRKRKDARSRSDRRERSAKWRTANPEKHRENDRKWRRANPEKARSIKAARIARKRGNGGRHSGEQIKALASRQGFRCAGCPASIRDGYHVDHVMPLALGGTNDIQNIQLLCPTCNLTKGAKHPIAWAQENGRLL